ncbi:uncharacterized protein LOC122535256 [Frieseomelitta varia]|uniref:uncharacterized protein LOC122535256 n=1 Tax=Frieseomelitta varia TaxID=561572 RepID=UPI001CB69ABA|nr:uncharacterized protein LOC122535256 [Frieseomelitta varia]XP_043522577.1 uncharacterized protein LOC122535256 [Frieseomelitta varia]XP_043522578.1 uncharacterized protein LOC122535256 [Frieseomelitta varia]
MPPRSNASSSRDTLNTVATTDEGRRTGRYVAGGAVLAIMLLAVHHALLREASTIAGVCIPAIIMACYIIWILYSAHRDRRKALRFAAAMQLTEVISVPAKSNEVICRNGTSKNELRKSNDSKLAYDTRKSCENPAYSSKDEAV